MSDIVTETVALIAGNKNFPLLVAARAKAMGRKVVAAAFTGTTDPALARMADEIIWLNPGQLQGVIDFFHAQKEVNKVMMAGGFSAQDLAAIKPDERGTRLLQRLKDLHNDAILNGIAEELEQEGLRVVGADEMIPELMVQAGILGRVFPEPQLYADLRIAWRMAKMLGEDDIGQVAVVAGGRVMALEGADGTDATILRGGSLGNLGRHRAVAAKVAKPGQDMRFDLPVIGLGTMEALIRGGLGAMIVEAGYTMIFDREAVIELADAHHVALVAWHEGDLLAFNQGENARLNLAA
ncbi:UDP-2,3-diacylglucosamine diphosphatase LpxI [Oxalobacter vibrioformis]|uniref:UDP-2,3-diacylglucosamine diphosphatase LpxI n=1 Tax=Oxalobacter vibrioformis TaxID=933080 RepID=A0A9E9P2P1_9BURK|nr:UDP-2,3-diacylglucosamine diphosphatase LpxI [Oxalobacter vibrioformis]WAW10094.1 UDP-2,3-diacylglucosamine diphosphatase LpxI [Oxalobacter vibrioformis]